MFTYKLPGLTRKHRQEGNLVKQMHIFIVEDERAISDLIRINLEAEGFVCDCAYDGLQAADILEDHDFDLILLDIMLPHIDGYELLEYIKPMQIPVIFLTAKASLSDRVAGLNLGAEDYIVKPFEISELIARIHVVLRRFQTQEHILSFLDFIIDLDRHEIHRGSRQIDLTPKEFDLFIYLVTHKGHVLPRDQIYEAIWQTDYDGNTRTLELHIQRLRKKLNLGEHLKTLYKSGYRLDE